MGAEAQCTVSMGRTRARGKALLETDELIFRGGDLRLSIPYATISAVRASGGALSVTTSRGTVVFELGDRASKWAERIRHPPKRIDKLGVKRGQRVLLLGVHDVALRREIEDAGGRTSTRLSGMADVIFMSAERREALRRLEIVQRFLEPAGAIWVIRPKGSAAVSERDVLSAGRQAGLVDVKVVRFSGTHTAEKFVIPASRR